MMEWKLIESAPRDGSFVMIYDAFYGRPWFARFVDYGSYTGWEDDSNHRGKLQATHWMPLPAPPRAESEAGEGA